MDDHKPSAAERPLSPKQSASRSRTTRRAAHFRWPAAVLALLVAALGLCLVMHYPLAPWAASLIFVACCASFFVWPDSWLVTIPLLLPLTGFAPWTGWITFEELDLLVLAAAAGGYARLAWPTRGTQSASRQPRRSLLVSFLLLLFAVSLLISMLRGFTHAGGFSFGWYQGYHEPMNSVRVAKSFFLALLMLPLWRAAEARRGSQAATRLTLGLMLGLLGASLATIWERVAFVDLLNFSTDYRTTGLFWEMHVGGAALDGFLTLLMPFALRDLFVPHTTRRWACGVACLALGVYACLTTFSRGVYLAVPGGLVVTVLLGALNTARRWPRGGAAPDTATVPQSNLGMRAVLWVLFGMAVLQTFPSSGYRGLLSLLGVAAVAMPLAGVLRRFKLVDWILGVAAGVLLTLALWAGSMIGSKGPYIGYAACLLLTLGLLFAERNVAPVPGNRVRVGLAAHLTLGGYLAVLMGAALVAKHWGYAAGGAAMQPVVAGFLLLSLACVASPKALWPADVRWQVNTWAGLAVVAGIVSVVGGGAYLSERFSTTSSDMDTRIAHWREGWNVLSGPLDLLLGKGLGRYPASYYLTGKAADHPGDYRLQNQEDNNYLVLAGGRQRYMSWGDILRVSQRIRTPKGPLTVSLRVRTARQTGVHLEVCEKHLLYNGACVVGHVNVKGMANVWQTLRVPLVGQALGNSDWYAPRLVAFSIATDTALGLVDVDNIELLGPDGRELLDNGDFSDNLKRWFFSSDHNHLPWHIKNLFMNVLFDQGWLGVLLFVSLLLAALWRVSFGTAKYHPLAPAIGGGLVGFVLVGLFDSLVDVPRLAFVFYLVLLLGLTVGRTAARGPLPERAAPP